MSHRRTEGSAAAILVRAALLIAAFLLAGLEIQAQHRVILASFDGLGQQILDEDPAADELRNLKEIWKRSFHATSVQPAFPSTTANSHAAIWTGAYGNRNGIAGNANPVLPRAEHTFLERRTGFRSESLLAEPLWVTAARQGLTVVAHQVTQVYPFTDGSAGLSLEAPPVVLNSYQTRKVADYQVLRAADVVPIEAMAWNPPIPNSALPPKHFTWKAGPVTLVGTLIAMAEGRSYDALVIAERPDGPRVVVRAVATETQWPRGRKLARHFSEALPVGDAATLRDFGPLGMCFRLWEATQSGDFLLLSTPLQELGVAHGADVGQEIAEHLLREAGPLAGNAPSWAYQNGRLGTPHFRGGDGAAELRILECIEFIARQYNRYTEWLWKRYQPRLMIDYFPFPDEMDHGWLGLSRETGSPQAEARARRFLEFRRRGYQIVDERIRVLRRLASDRRTILAVTSDHGMAPVTKTVNINAALREAGYLSLGANGEIDAASSRAVGDYAILLNTRDWKRGIIPLTEKQKSLEDLIARLRKIRDPETGPPVFREFFTEAEHGKEYGIGGPAGFDLYFDLAPGYAPGRSATGPVVEALEVPGGRHGFLPTRDDMRAIFIANAERLPERGSAGMLRSTQIAPIICRWLGIAAPQDASGTAAAPPDVRGDRTK